MATFELPESLIQLFEKDDVVGWGIKNSNSEYVYSNKTFNSWLSLPNHYSVEGVRHGAFPAPVAEFAPIFESQDRIIESSQLAIRSITTHVHDNKLQPVYAVHEPLINEQGESIGTVISVRAVNIITPTSLLNGKIEQHAIFQPPSEIFTEKEWEVIYLLQCGFALKEISSVIGISVDAINGRLRSCFKKVAVNSSGALLEYCRHHHFDNYIPQLFLKKGHLIITS